MLDAKVGSFSISASDIVGTTIPITGLDFSPKAFMFFWTGRDGLVDSFSRTNAFIGMAFASATTERRVSAGMAEDSVGTTDTNRWGVADAVVLKASITDTEDGIADLDSVETDGFTIIIDQVFGKDMTIGYVALGGDSITDALVQDFVSQNALGFQSITDILFQPDFVAMHAIGTGTALPVGPGNNLQLTVAAMISSLEQATVGNNARNAQATVDANSYLITSEAFTTVGSGGGVNNRFVLSGMTPNGFDVEHIEADDDRVNYLALKGGDYAIGSLQTRTDGADIVVTGLDFKPSVIFFVSHTDAENVADVSSIDGIISMGAATGPDEQICHHYHNEDGIATTEVRTAIEFDAVYISSVNGPALDGTMKLKSIEDDGFICFMSDPDTVAADVVFWAFGPGAAGGPHRRMLFGVTH